MIIFDKIAEKHRQDAIAPGQMDNPDWYGKPLPEDDLSLAPEELRMGYRIMKNAGFVPPEIKTTNEINRLNDQLIRDIECKTLKQAVNRLTCLNMRLEECSDGCKFNLALQDQYYNKLVTRFETPIQD